MSLYLFVDRPRVDIFIGIRMLKRKLFVSIFGFASLAFAASASAQTYVGGAFGATNAKMGCPWQGNCKTSDTSYKIIGGYTLDKNFAIEVNYFTLGSARISYSNGYGDYALETKQRGFSLAAVTNHSFGEKFGGFAKLGIANIRSKDARTSAQISEPRSSSHFSNTFTESHLLIGLGLTYKITDQLSLRAEVEQFRLKGHLRRKAHQNVSVGAQYSF